MRLDLRDITAGYGGSTVIRDVQLVVPAGRVVALVGSNGAGKSTLLKVASGLLAPSNGQVLLDDIDHTHTRADQRAARGVCHVTETGSLYPGLSVAENLRMFAGRRAVKRLVDQAVEAFPGLANHLRQAAGTLSGGEQRMLALARAYLTDPRLILIDEISLGLAPIVVDEIFEFLGELVSRGTTLLIVEQYVARALALADLAYVMSRGQIAFVGEPSELRHSDLLAGYLGAV